MKQVEAEIVLEVPNGEAFPEIIALREEIESELTASHEREGVTVSQAKESTPEGVQGLPVLVSWLIEFVSENPELLLQVILFALGEALNHYRSKNQQSEVTIKVMIDDKTIDLSQKDVSLKEKIEDVLSE